jgi:hypothetical protein
MNLPYTWTQAKKAIFGDEKEVTIKEFKERSAKIRLGGKNWFPLAKEFEDEGRIKFRGHWIKLEK